MEVQSAAASVLASLDSLLSILGESIQERLFRSEKGQPGSIKRALLRTQGRLTSKLEHRDNAHVKIMMLGPVADSLARRIGEIADPESGVLSVVDFRLNRVSESLRASAHAARGRVASQLARAQTLIATQTNLQSTHAGLMGRLSGDVMIDQLVRREITDIENQLANVHREESQILDSLRSEAEAMRHKIDAVVQMLGGYIRLGFFSRSASETQQPKTIEQVGRMSPEEVAIWWSSLEYGERRVYDAKFGHILRNVDGMPIDYRIKANEQYLESAARANPKIRDALEREGLLDETGQLTSRVVLFDTSDTESFGESITAHGNCQNYDNVNLHYEGTGAGPGTNGSKLRDHYDKMDFSSTGAQHCTTTFVMRNTRNAQWGSLEKSPATAYGVDYNATQGVNFVDGLRANGNANILHVTGHSHGTRSAGELGCRVNADVVHFMDPAPKAFTHMSGDCVNRVMVYRDIDSSDADAKILQGGLRGFIEGVAEKAGNELWIDPPLVSILDLFFDDNKASKLLAAVSRPEQALWESRNKGVLVTEIESGDYGVTGGQRDSVIETNGGSSHSSFTYQSWRLEQRNAIARETKRIIDGNS